MRNARETEQRERWGHLRQGSQGQPRREGGAEQRVLGGGVTVPSLEAYREDGGKASPCLPTSSESRGDRMCKPIVCAQTGRRFSVTNPEAAWGIKEQEGKKGGDRGTVEGKALGGGEWQVVLRSRGGSDGLGGSQCKQAGKGNHGPLDLPPYTVCLPHGYREHGLMLLFQWWG